MNDESVPTAPTISPPPEKKPIKLTDAEKEIFFKAFLSDKPYEESVSMFDGKILAKFKTLNINENDVVFAQIGFDSTKGIARTDDSYLIKIVEYRLCGSLLSLNGVPFCEEITMESHPSNKEAGTTYLTERLKVMQTWPTFKLGAVTEAFNYFEAKVQQLTKESFVPTF